MKTKIHFWSHLTQFLEWEMFQIKLYRKSKHIFCSVNFSQQPYRLWDNLKKYDRAGQATGDNIICCMCNACWINKATNTHSEYIILIAFLLQKWLSEGLNITLYLHGLSCYFKQGWIFYLLCVMYSPLNVFAFQTERERERYCVYVGLWFGVFKAVFLWI